MNLSLLKTFLVVVEAGSYAKASLILKIDESAISRQMARLKDELGQPIFLPPRPGPYGPQLTTAGKVLLEKAPSLIEHYTSIQEELHATALGHLGTLSITINTSLNEEIVEKYLVPLDSQEKDLLYELKEATTAEQEELLLHSKAELGVTNTHVATPEYFEILSHIDMPYQVFCLEDHPLVQLNRPLKLKDLDRVPLGLTHNSAPRFVAAMRSRGLMVLPKIQSNVRLTSIAAARKGVCVAIFPAKEGVHIEGLRAVLLEEPALKGETTLYHLKGKSLSPAAKAFVKLYLSQNQ